MRPLVFCLFVLLAAPALAASWGSYENARFAYQLDIPPDFDSGTEADNGDGRVFRSLDGSQLLRVYGGHTLQPSFEASIDTAMDLARDAGWDLSYERVTPSWASYSGTRNGMILYARAIALCGGSSYASFELEYPAHDLEAMHPVVERLVASLTGSNAGAGC
jgi:hypothetical protein